jgi:hypothetical protein
VYACVQRRLAFEPRREPVHRPLRLRDARAAREVGAQRLAREQIALLRQEADRESGRQPDLAAVGLVDAGEQAEQGRLAGAVRPDEADSRTRRHDDVDPREDDLSTVGLRDAGSGEHCDLQTRTRPSDKLSLGRDGRDGSR